MALLKAFVCQLFLFGMYKLILEQVVEKHFVPDELTRNCIFGFICLLCFGIQLYTDKADDGSDEAEDNPYAKSNSQATGTMKTGMPSADIYETSHNVTTGQGKYMSSMDEEVADSKEGHATVSPIELGMANISKVSDSTFLPDLSIHSSETPTKISKVGGKVETNETASIAEDTLENSSARNGITDYVYEEDEDSLEIDHLDEKEPSLEGDGHSTTIETKDSVVIPENIEESEYLSSNVANILSTQDTLENLSPRNELIDMVYEEDGENGLEIDHLDDKETNTERNEQLTETKQVLLISEDIVEVVEESGSNGVDVSSFRDLDKATNLLKTNELTADVHNELVVESLKNTKDVSSKHVLVNPPNPEMTDESKTEIHDESFELSLNNVDNKSPIITERTGIQTKGKMAEEQETSVATESIECSQTITESSLSPSQADNAVSSTKLTIEKGADDKFNAKSSTLVDVSVSSLEKVLPSMQKEKLAAIGDVCSTPVTIDISFIYACH